MYFDFVPDFVEHDLLVPTINILLNKKQNTVLHLCIL